MRKALRWVLGFDIGDRAPGPGDGRDEWSELALDDAERRRDAVPGDPEGRARGPRGGDALQPDRGGRAAAGCGQTRAAVEAGEDELAAFWNAISDPGMGYADFRGTTERPAEIVLRRKLAALLARVTPHLVDAATSPVNQNTDQMTLEQLAAA